MFYEGLDLLSLCFYDYYFYSDVFSRIWRIQHSFNFGFSFIFSDVQGEGRKSRQVMSNINKAGLHLERKHADGVCVWMPLRSWDSEQWLVEVNGKEGGWQASLSLPLLTVTKERWVVSKGCRVTSPTVTTRDLPRDGTVWQKSSLSFRSVNYYGSEECHHITKTREVFKMVCPD